MHHSDMILNRERIAYPRQLGWSIQTHTASLLLLLLVWLWGHKQNMLHIPFESGRWFIGLPQLWHSIF